MAARGRRATRGESGDWFNSRSPDETADIVAAFRQGLKEAGFADGENVTIISRFAAGNFAQLPDLAADLIRDGVSLIVATGGTVSAVKVKPVVPRTIPIAVAALHALPAADGALASYGTSLTEANRQLGIYSGRILPATASSLEPYCLALII
jgi:hypothetical protein